MSMAKISRAAVVLLGVGGLAVAVPEVTTAKPPEPTARCLSGVYRVQVQPSRTLYAVKSTWIPFVTMCAKGEVSTAPA
ncbi:hypothetical protein Amsp01_048140 [Amycolatopsis sp. NBRC 101858]|uniref:hypothetical protein n=1 Tax=Amycolatopsis sp. NBRC 101858 TaxID=3032200 RepID=UPI0024A00348|nr:hypothetical protein [Amycolatopsis sp. NBRC 101858]GLY38790.1 hypothetical protein Amsp01_048140 [Amycolatopsis sp. NBRC 101858]